jgi:signal transduction histidine kinase
MLGQAKLTTRHTTAELGVAYFLLLLALVLFYWTFYSMGHLGGGAVLWTSVSSGLFFSVLVIVTVHLLRANRALELSRRRDAAIGSISHTLRTPLTVISLYADALMKSPALSGQDEECCASIARESARLLRLLEDGLSMARISAGKQHYRMEPADLGSIVQSTLADHEGYLRKSGYDVRKALGASALPIDADKTAVAQAIENVLQNAIKYGGDSKYLRVATYRIHGSAIVEVTDRGVGIPEADRDRVFQEFYRSSAVSDKRGWGLGLCIVKHIIDEHGGAIRIQSVVGRGTEVRIAFPIRERVPHESPQEARYVRRDDSEWRLGRA